MQKKKTTNILFGISNTKIIQKTKQAKLHEFIINTITVIIFSFWGCSHFLQEERRRSEYGTRVEASTLIETNTHNI